MTNANAGWYDDGSGIIRWFDGQRWTDTVQPPAPNKSGLGSVIDQIEQKAAAGGQARPAANDQAYVVLQVILKEKMWGSGSGNLTELENAINAQAALGYRLHTISTAASGSKGMGGGDRIQATMVFEKI